MRKFISGNMIAFKRILLPARYAAELFDASYASKAHTHASRPESEEEQSYIIRWLREHGSLPRRILDVGCNAGQPLGAFCSAFGAEGAGIDVNAAAIAMAKRSHPNGRFFEYDGNALPFADQAFDHVMLHHVIGHVQDPESTLREIARVLKPGGTLSVITTNAWYQFWQTPFNIMNGFLPDTTVLRYYTLKGLGRLLLRHGFRLQELCTWTPLASRAIANQQKFCRLRLMALAVKC